MAITHIRALVKQDLDAVDALMANALDSHTKIIHECGNHLIKSGGKRIRPLLVLLGAHSFQYEGQDHIQLAAAIEFFHTATLLHDDVVDGSKMRRGKATANNVWGNKVSVLVGDFLFTRSFELMVQTKHLPIIEVLAHASNTITKGEILQLLNCHNPDTTIERYLEVIRCKTSVLFEASAQLGAHLTGQSEKLIKAMAAFGLHLGNAYQLVDDILDYTQSPETLGKNIGDDIREGKPTLPLLYALQRSHQKDKAVLLKAIREGAVEDITPILACLKITNAISDAFEVAKDEIAKAQSALAMVPSSTYQAALNDLADFVIARVN